MSLTSINATGPTLIKSGTPSPSRVSSPPKIRAAANNPSQLPYQSLAKDLESLSNQINALHSTLTGTQPTINQILIQNQLGQVVAAIGEFLYQGAYYNNWFSELHAGDNKLTNDPNNAIFNVNADGSVTIGGNGWESVLDAFNGIAAYIGTQNDTVKIADAENNGSGLIRLTVPANTTLITGNQVTVLGMQNAGVPNATGTWTVSVVNSTHVDLQGSVWAGAFVAPPVPFGIDTTSPTIDRVLQISGAVSSGGLIKITTTIAHTYETGDRVNIPGLPGVPNGIGQWTITVVDATHYTLNGSTFAGSYTAGGTCLRFFAGMLAQTFATGPSFENYTLRAFADGSLSIKNATITLSSSAGTIVLDPNGPDILITNSSNSASLELLPTGIILKDRTGAVIANIGVDGSGNGAITFTDPGITGGTITNATIVGGTISATTVIPKASTTQFGVVEVDGTTIVSTAGVISAVGAGLAVYSTIDPRRYGAAGNGATDDSAAISSAIAAGGLYLQSGIVYAYTWAGISAAIGAISNNGWLCSGGGSLLLLSGSTSALTLTGTVIRAFENVTINGNGHCGSNPVVAMSSGSRVSMRNVIVFGGTSGQYAINLNAMTLILFIGCDVAAESPNGLNTTGGSTWNAFSNNGIPDNIGGW